ncbi:MAG: glycosyltransferase family 2 protein [Mobilitalea sp.]
MEGRLTALRYDIELTILMPCLNEQETICACIIDAQSFIKRNALTAEVLIADNGSTDASAYLAEQLGARVVSISQKGYGNALKGGIEKAKGRYVIMGDCDRSYDFSKLEGFLATLREGNDLVIGNRFAGGIQKGAMPISHRYFGVPLLSLVGRLVYRVTIGDFHCGLRGFSREAYLNLNIKSDGMEFASEMIGAFAKKHLKIVEIPTILRKDGRNGRPHLRTVRDGMRHIILLLKAASNYNYKDGERTT